MPKSGRVGNWPSDGPLFAYTLARSRCAVDRNALAARILKLDGILLLLVAVIHFAATPFALGFVAGQSSPESYAQIKPPFLLSFVLVGVLLLPIGLSTFYCAEFIRRGQRWARTICYFNTVGILLLPLSLGKLLKRIGCPPGIRTPIC